MDRVAPWVPVRFRGVPLSFILNFSFLKHLSKDGCFLLPDFGI
nr:MAG TPA: hypothetical protein [Caudoviricetes sp.]